MKKVLFVLFAVLALFIVGCSGAQVDEDVSVDAQANSDGGVDAEIKVDLEEVDAVDVDLSEWCQGTWDYAAEGASVSVELVGVEMYKGKEYCRGEHTQEIQGMTIETTYYTTATGDDIWVLSTVNGQTSEIHVTDSN